MKIVYDLPFSEYIKKADHISNHYFGYLDECPAALRYALDNPPEEPSQDMLFGTLFDIAIENLDFFKQIVTRNETVMDKIVEDEDGGYIVGYRNYDKLLIMVDRTLHHPKISKILAKGNFQVSVFTEIDGHKVKSRPDFLPDHLPIIPDFKTTRVKPTPRALRNESAKYKYYRAAAFYLDQQPERIAFDLIWVPKIPPFEPVVEELAIDDETLAFGRWSYRKRLAQYKECMESNIWPGHWQIRKHEIPKCVMQEEGYHD